MSGCSFSVEATNAVATDRRYRFLRPSDAMLLDRTGATP